MHNRGFMYCSCEAPIFDAEHDAGCRRCGLPIDFTPQDPDEVEAEQQAPFCRQGGVVGGAA